MSRSLISVIVPIYNVEQYLRRCVESIIGQTYPYLEVILVDDGSADNSGAICDEYTLRDPRIRSFHVKNSGVSVARNYGIEHARGQFIVFVDGDDFIHCQMIERLYTAVCDGADIAICSCSYITGDEKDEKIDEIAQKQKIIGQKALLDDLYYLKRPFQAVEVTAVWGKIYCRSLLGDIRFDPLMSVGEDFLFNYDYMTRINTGAILAYKGYDYRINDNGVMHSAFDERKRRTFERIRKLTAGEQDNLGFVTRMVNIVIILMLMSCSAEENHDLVDMTDFIKQYRGRVLWNPKARLKVRASLALSYGGFENMMKLYRKVKQLMQKVGAIMAFAQHESV